MASGSRLPAFLKTPPEAPHQFGDLGAVKSSNPFDDSAQPFLVTWAEEPRNNTRRIRVELLGYTFDLHS